MTPYEHELKTYKLKDLRQHYPTLQKRIYDILLELTPAQLQFEMAELPKSKTFCQEGLDQETYEIIGTVMSSVLDEPKLIMTLDDVRVTYMRFRELLFLYEATRQGIMTAVTDDTGINYFFNMDVPDEFQEEPENIPERYACRIRRYYGKLNS